VIAEHGLHGPLIGVAADGTGYGDDATIWGGEILVADLAGYTRAGHLATFPLPGGDQAIRQPWRVAAALLEQCYGPAFLDRALPFARQLDQRRWATIRQMIARGLNSPSSSSLGRVFDAVAALVGLRGEVRYEGQAAIELEACAEPGQPGYDFVIAGQTGGPFQIDLRPAIMAIVEDVEAGVVTGLVAGRFHRTIAECLAAACRRVRAASQLSTVALSGGVFQNRLLLETLGELLRQDDFLVYTNRRVPPNDGGISLGQAAVAATRYG
jgi:hydrogenase maturation protein HypF